MRVEISVCADFVAGLGEGGCVNLGEGGFVGFSEEPRGGLRVDLRGLGSLALPGVFDLHVHLRGLGLSYKEDEYSGTAAAAAGCVAGVADMPNTRPELREPGALASKLEALKANAVVDYGVYAGIPRRDGLAGAIASMGVLGFKVYPEDLRPSPGLCQALREAEERGLVVVLHPELEEAFQLPDWGFERETVRPCTAEEAAVEELRALMDVCGAWPRVHVTHVSCPGTALRARSYGFTVDVTPHHLFAGEVLPPYWSPCALKVNPPLKGRLEARRLQDLLLEGLVDAVASDHAPHSPGEKLWNPHTCPPGFPWLEWWAGFTALRLLRHLGPEGLAELASRAPRRILGAPGGYESGSVSVISLEPARITAPRYSKAPYTPFQGLEYYPCLATVVGGKLVYTRWEGVVGVPGSGRWISPKPGS